MGKLMCAHHICPHTLQHVYFFSILHIKFEFGLTSIYLDIKRLPVCTKFYITILLQNDEHSGSIPLIMTVKPKLHKCNNNLYSGDVDSMKDESEFVPLDAVVIIIVILSSITCIRSLIKSSMLAKVCVFACLCVTQLQCSQSYVCT